jgi:hypothetical protein
MKRTILLTMLALSLTLGASSAHASCTSCRGGGPYTALSPWQQAMLVLSTVYGVVYIPG